MVISVIDQECLPDWVSVVRIYVKVSVKFATTLLLQVLVQIL